MTREEQDALDDAVQEAAEYRAVARNLAQVLLLAANMADDAGESRDAALFRTAYARQCRAHGVDK